MSGQRRQAHHRAASIQSVSPVSRHLSFGSAFALLLAGPPLLLVACSQESNTAKPLLQWGGRSSTPAQPGPGSVTAGRGGAHGDVRITSFGPLLAESGIPFNRQPNGQSALWVRLSEDMSESHVAVYFAGQKLVSSVVGKEVTALVPLTFYAKPGKYPVVVAGDSMGRDFRTDAAYIDVH